MFVSEALGDMLAIYICQVSDESGIVVCEDSGATQEEISLTFPREDAAQKHPRTFSQNKKTKTDVVGGKEVRPLACNEN